MLNIYLVTLLITAVNPIFQVETLDGHTATGPIIQLDNNQAEFANAKGTVSLKTKTLLKLTPQIQPPKKDGPPDICIYLVDQSIINALEFTVLNQRARITLSEAQVIDMPVDRILAVRLETQSPKHSEAWSQILTKERQDDWLVTQKEDSLDYYRGVLEDTTDSKVYFSVEGNTMSVKRAKVFGLAYFRPSIVDQPAITCRIHEANGSRWNIESLSLSDDNSLHCQTPSGAIATIPLAQISSIDFSPGKVFFLDDMDPEKIRFTPYFGQTSDIPHWKEFFTSERSSDKNQIRMDLGGKTYHRGLAMHSRTQTIFRLPKNYRWFRALAGIDDRFRPYGHVQLIIRGDDHTLLEISLNGDSPPLPIALDIKNFHRLEILVDFGKRMDVGDRLDLCNARITK